MGLGDTTSTQSLLNNEYSTNAMAPPGSPSRGGMVTPAYAASIPTYMPPPAYANKFGNIPRELAPDARNVLTEITKVGISPEHQAQVCLVLDISPSMQNPNLFYYNPETDEPGPILRVIKQAVITAMAFDDNQKLDDWLNKNGFIYDNKLSGWYYPFD